MSAPEPCPGIEDLVRLAANDSPPEDSARLCQHLERCPSCVAALRRISAGRTMVLNRPNDSSIPLTRPGLSDSQIPTVRVTGSDSMDTPPGLGVADATKLLDPPRDSTEIGRLGHYRVLRILGIGGMGTVYEAEDTHLQRPTALKVLHPEMVRNRTARERLLREARAAANLKDDRIATVYQVGEKGDVPYLAMEYLEGETLDARLYREGRLSPGEILHIGREVAEGLAAAHESGLIHRDIKPANIFLCRAAATKGPDGQPAPVSVKILDFGLVRPAEKVTELTSKGQVLGTPDYMSPEQARGRPVDARCDLFSLGCVLYRMAAGQAPFRGETAMVVLTALASEEPTPLESLNPDLPLHLVALVRRLMAKEPDDRPVSARAVADELAAIERSLLPPAASSTRRRWLLAMGVGALGGVGALAVAMLRPSPPIRVGLLWSLTGPHAGRGRSAQAGTLLAIEEINREGGLVGRSLLPVERDGRSEGTACEAAADELLLGEKVRVLFGCEFSEGRKFVLRSCQKHDGLLVHSSPFEGLEQSSHAVHVGPVPNQVAFPPLDLLRRTAGRLWIVASRDLMSSLSAETIRYQFRTEREPLIPDAIPFTDPAMARDRLSAEKPGLIVSTAGSEALLSFLQNLGEANLGRRRPPALLIGLTWAEVREMLPLLHPGDMVSGTPFLGEAQRQASNDPLHGEPARLAYNSVHLWAQAVESAKTDAPSVVRSKLPGQSRETPAGRLAVEANYYTTHRCCLLRLSPDGRFEEEKLQPSEPIQPVPYPASQSRGDWDALVRMLAGKAGTPHGTPGVSGGQPR